MTLSVKRVYKKTISSHLMHFSVCGLSTAADNHSYVNADTEPAGAMPLFGRTVSKVLKNTLSLYQILEKDFAFFEKWQNLIQKRNSLVKELKYWRDGKTVFGT